MPVGSIPYFTRSGRFSRTDRSSFLDEFGLGHNRLDATLQDRKLLPNIPHAKHPVGQALA